MAAEVQQKTPLEVVEEVLDECLDYDYNTDGELRAYIPAHTAKDIFDALHAEGYVLARARVQWRH